MSARSSAASGFLRRSGRSLRRWTLRAVVLVALVNLGWDLWSWQDRRFAEGDRRYFRGAEQGHEIDYGLADIRIINETGREYLIDSFVLDGWGGPLTGRSDAQRTLWPAGETGSTFAEQRYLDRLIGDGRLVLRDGVGGSTRVVTFQIDRRQPISCQFELRIGEEGESLSGCHTLRRLRTDFRWLFGPPNYD